MKQHTKSIWQNIHLLNKLFESKDKKVKIVNGKDERKGMDSSSDINKRFPCRTKGCKNTITSYRFNNHDYYCNTCKKKRNNPRQRTTLIPIPKTDEAFDNLCAKLGKR